MKYKKKNSPALRAKAREMAKPLYARPKALGKIQETNLLRAQHIAQQERLHKRNEYDRMTGQIHSTVQPGLKAALVAQRSKLLK